MPIIQIRNTFARVFTQRCFLLFAALVVLILAAPYIGGSVRGQITVNGVQALVLVAAVAAVGRTMMPFVIGSLLGISAFGFLLAAQVLPEDATRYFAWTHGFYIAFYAVAVVYLLRYVFSPDVMTEDKLFGAASGYLMLGVLWAYAYRLLLLFEPQAFGSGPGKVPPTFAELMYMSFGCLTSNGLGDISPASSKARTLVMIEQVFGTLFVAILIARLAGIYPPKASDAREERIGHSGRVPAL
jgi:hypothetical protein